MVNLYSPDRAERNLMEFNKGQREGIAKIADNLATACMVAAIVGGLVDQKIDGA